MFRPQSAIFRCLCCINWRSLLLAIFSLFGAAPCIVLLWCGALFLLCWCVYTHTSTGETWHPPVIGSLKLSGHDPGHLVMQFRIHSEFPNNPTLPFYRSLGPRFVLGHLWPTLFSLFPPTPPYESPILNSILASWLTRYFFAAYVSC
jgi:hypothetical protein